jgi:hypothetical protein
MNKPRNSGGGSCGWRSASLCILVVIVPWALYVNIHPSNTEQSRFPTDFALTGAQSAQLLGQITGFYYTKYNFENN